MEELLKKGWFKACLISLGIILFLFANRNEILNGIGNWLVKSDQPEMTECCFVLGGNSFERGLAAVQVFEKFPEQKFATTGGNYPYQILCLDTTMFEAELTKHMMVRKGISTEQIDTLTSAHSTMEESDEIMQYCKERQLQHITILSSAFHLRRVRWVFEDKFEDAGIKVNFHGATAIEYDQTNWWKNEEGMIMVNNELIKLLYYFIKY